MFGMYKIFGLLILIAVFISFLRENVILMLLILLGLFVLIIIIRLVADLYWNGKEKGEW